MEKPKLKPLIKFKASNGQTYEGVELRQAFREVGRRKRKNAIALTEDLKEKFPSDNYEKRMKLVAPLYALASLNEQGKFKSQTELQELNYVLTGEAPALLP